MERADDNGEQHPRSPLYGATLIPAKLPNGILQALDFCEAKDWCSSIQATIFLRQCGDADAETGGDAGERIARGGHIDPRGGPAAALQPLAGMDGVSPDVVVTLQLGDAGPQLPDLC